MDLVLGLSILGAAIAAFMIGYKLGKKKIYVAILKATYKLEEKGFNKSTDWVEGAANAIETVLSFMEKGQTNN